MKQKPLIIITFCIIISIILTVQNASAQITLTSQMLDSIISNTVLMDIKPINKKGSAANWNVLVFSYLENPGRTLYMSYTFFITRRALPPNACIYQYDGFPYFIIFNGINTSDELKQNVAWPDTPEYIEILDSLDLIYLLPGGVYLQRRKLVVYEITKKRFKQRKYLITSKTYIPYATAPEELKPQFPITEEHMSNDEYAVEYKTPRYTYTDFYYEEMKPIVPRTITLKRE